PGRIGGEDAEQRELFLRQVDQAPADLDLATRRVDQQLADPHRALVAAVAAPQDRGDPGAQLLVEIWLLDIVVGSQVEAADAVGGAAAAGGDDGRAGRGGSRSGPP